VLAKYSYDQTKDLANLISEVVKLRLPDIISLERSPGKRKGCVYMDYLQNRCGATMAAPYSLRPRVGAPVSTPLEWSEVDTKLDPLKYNILTVPKRIEKNGDIWRGFFKHKLDIAKALEKLKKLL
jgi:bifunctional non-homologous end joining protein LigD